MRKKLKGIFCLAVIVLILTVEIVCQPVYGASSSELKKDKGVKWLTENVCFYITTLYAKGDIDEGDKGMMQMNYIDRYNIAMELTGYKYREYIDDSDEEGMLVLENGNYVLYYPIDSAFANELYVKLFHKPMQSPDRENTLVKAKSLNGYIYVNMGEFGNFYPAYSMKSITKVKKGVYKVKTENRFRMIDSEDGKKYSCIGHTWVTLKKDKKAEYGYRVVKCSYRMFR